VWLVAPHSRCGSYEVWLVAPQSRCGSFEGHKNTLPLPGMEPQYLGCPTPRLVTIPTDGCLCKLGFLINHTIGIYQRLIKAFVPTSATFVQPCMEYVEKFINH
jgi:hypothetical protein